MLQSYVLVLCTSACAWYTWRYGKPSSCFRQLIHTHLRSRLTLLGNQTNNTALSQVRVPWDRKQTPTVEAPGQMAMTWIISSLVIVIAKNTTKRDCQPKRSYCTVGRMRMLAFNAPIWRHFYASHGGPQRTLRSLP